MSDEPRSVGHLLRTLRTEFRVALSAHRPYILFSVFLLLGSMPVGALFWQQGRGVTALPLSETVTKLLAQQFPAPTLLGNNMELFSLLVVGALSVGLLTALGLVVQGIVAGYFLALSAGEYGTGLLFVAVVPHGVLLFSGFVLAAAISFRLVACTLGRLVGIRPRTLDNTEWRQSGLLLVCAWLALVASAVVESSLTFRLTDLLF